MAINKLLAALASVSLAVLPVAAEAHGSMKPSHGGIVTMSGETVVELVPTQEGADFYLSDEDLPLAASDFTGTATVTVGGTKKSVALVAQAGNRMTAPGLQVSPGTKVVLALTGNGNAAKSFATFMVE